MTSRYRKLLLANGACVARLTCASLCQFKELVRSKARFLTFRILFREETMRVRSFNTKSCKAHNFRASCSSFPIFARSRLPWYTIVRPLVIAVRFRDYVARDISTFQISSGTSFLRFAFPASLSRQPFFHRSLTSRTARTQQHIFLQLCALHTLYTLIVFASTLLRVPASRNDSRYCFRCRVSRGN